MTCNELLNILGTHSRELGRNNHFANQDGWILLTGEINELSEPDENHQGDENQCQTRGVETKPCDTVHVICSVYSLVGGRVRHGLDLLTIAQKRNTGYDQDITWGDAFSDNHIITLEALDLYWRLVHNRGLGIEQVNMIFTFNRTRQKSVHRYQEGSLYLSVDKCQPEFRRHTRAHPFVRVVDNRCDRIRISRCGGLTHLGDDGIIGMIMLVVE